VSAGIGYLIFVGLGDWAGLDAPGLVVPQLPPYEGTHVLDLLVGVVVGVVTALIIAGVRRSAARLESEGTRRLGMPALLIGGGLAVGLLALLSDALGGTAQDVLFSGQASVPVEVTATTTQFVLVVLACKTVAYAVSLGCGFRGGPIFPAVFVGVGVASLPVVWFDVSPTLAVAVGAAAGMAAQARLLFAPLLFADLLVGQEGLGRHAGRGARGRRGVAVDGGAGAARGGSVRTHRRRGLTPFVGLGPLEILVLGRGTRRLGPDPVDDRPDDDDGQPDHDDPAEHRQRTQRCHQRDSVPMSTVIGRQASAFAFSWSNSCCVIAPLSSSSFARAISPAEPAEPPSVATLRT
jgi:hypothetical protein